MTRFSSKNPRSFRDYVPNYINVAQNLSSASRIDSARFQSAFAFWKRKEELGPLKSIKGILWESSSGLQLPQMGPSYRIWSYVLNCSDTDLSWRLRTYY